MLRSSTGARVRGGLDSLHHEAVVIGAGWHPALFRTEADTLLESPPEVLHPHALSMPLESAQTLIGRSSLAAEVLSPAGVATLENVVAEVADSFLALNIEMSSIAVRASRAGDKLANWSSREVAGEIGGRLVDAGWKVDLSNPEVVLRVHLLAPAEHTAHPDERVMEPVVTWGLTIHEGDDWAQRTAPNRPFFKPVSLDPKLARAMVNLACPNGGSLLDPFCGTGGILVEGVLCGLDSYGGDLAWPMVTGTRENAKWAQERGGSGTFEVRNGSATDLANWHDIAPFDGFAFDPPYGRNAWKSGGGFELFEGALSACAKVATTTARLVTLVPWSPTAIHGPLEEGVSFGKRWSEIEQAFSSSGWVISATFPIRVHRSLARLLVVAERA